MLATTRFSAQCASARPRSPFLAALRQTREEAAKLEAAKRELDPQLIFRNTLWDSYLEAL